MVLGSAQLGMDYGISNIMGRPSRKEAIAILEDAWNSGIKIFDTAPGYGSENIIGEFAKINKIEAEVEILTKIPSIKNNSKWKDSIYKTIDNSFSNLNCSSLRVLFFHSSDDSLLLLKEQNFFYRVLEKFPILHLGVSVYSPEEVKRLEDCEFELAYQFPFNLLDRRFKSNTIIKGLRYARSIFLQGILTKSSYLKDSAPENVKKIKRITDNYFSKKQVNPLHCALKFVANSEDIDYFLFGVDTKDQLDEILSIDLLNYNPDIELDKIISTIDRKWLNPRNWKY